jgi:RNA methyltransferase, TrmH family
VRTITSRQNPLVALCRRLAHGHHDEGTRSTLLLDGLHLVQEAIDADVPLNLVAVNEDLWHSGGPERDLVARVEPGATEVVLVSRAVMEAMSPVRTPSGMVAVARWQDRSPDRVLAGETPLLVLAIDVQDPGNVGAMIRTAEAAGATGFIACGVSADPLGWKALRGSMGSAFRLPLLRQVPSGDARSLARTRGLALVAAARGGRDMTASDLRRPVALMLGGEGAGLPPGALADADDVVSIPMTPPVESLNVAVATGVLLYEAYRQRKGRARES